MDEQQMDEIVDLAYKILMQAITIEETEKYEKDEIRKALELLDEKDKSDEFKVLERKLKKKLRMEAIKNSDNFDLETFVDKPDYDLSFPYECPFNKRTHKAALGLIFPDKAFYCEVPIHSNHANMATEYYRRSDPKYEDLSFYQYLHPEEENGWQGKITKEDQAIVIHFLPNEYGAAFCIPEEITPFQRQELEKINQLLEEKGIERNTNKDDKNLSEYLEEQIHRSQLQEMMEKEENTSQNISLQN